MSKAYESKVDPEELIRSFREEPSGLAGLKKAKNDDAPVSAPATEKSPKTTAARKSNTSSASSDPAEEEFRQRFVLDMTYMRPQSKYLMVEINPDFLYQIRRILSYEKGPACSLKAYINNVICEHLDKYADIIAKRL